MRPTLAFVRDRLLSMAERPSAWAGGQEAFILQLALLVEVSHIGTPERYGDRQQALLAELSGPDAGCAVPNDPVTPEWAKQAVMIARKYVMP
jgi:hypothetical protein